VKQDGQGTMGNDILRQMRPLELWNLCDAPNLSGSHVDRRPLVVLLSALETQLVTLGYDRLRLNTVKGCIYGLAILLLLPVMRDAWMYNG
jgi:hypothetical protein